MYFLICGYFLFLFHTHCVQVLVSSHPPKRTASSKLNTQMRLGEGLLPRGVTCLVRTQDPPCPGELLQHSVSCLLIRRPGHLPKSPRDSRAEVAESLPYRLAAEWLATRLCCSYAQSGDGAAVSLDSELTVGRC